MPRLKLSSISTSTLQAELQRRMAKLGDLIAQRDALDEQISELQGLAGQAQEAPQAAAAAGKTPGRKSGRKPKAVPPAGKPLAEYVREVLAATTLGMGMTDIEEAVLAAG
jgi:septal ring factor EnvC (AmiA/AmiB activator)